MPTTLTTSKRAGRLDLVRDLASHAHQLREHLSETLRHRRDRLLTAAHTSLTEALSRDVSYDEAADVFAQSTICAAAILACDVRPSAGPTAVGGVKWLLNVVTTWERWVLEKARELAASPSPHLPLSPSHTSSAHLYDTFLHHYAKKDRKCRGVFFTPKPIADFIVAECDLVLREDFALADGLSDATRPLILDPATGTGIFLLAAIDHIRRSSVTRWQAAGCNSAEINSRWNAYVPSLLPRLIGIEILPAPALLAKLNITLQLAATGYTFTHPTPINIHLADALSPATHSALRIPHSAFPIVLGNPPFSSLSTNTNPWITRLVRGDDEVRGYIRANGQQLGERKTWLHDDYVKFIRLAQWHVEQAGAGLIGFVTNHGYLDNATFRLMRHELLRVFPHIHIFDLHGNRKKHEVSPDGTPDENVFHLDQGVAIGILARCASEGNAGPSHQPRVDYTELWGARDSKLQALSGCSSSQPALRAHVLLPSAPDWRLVPSPAQQSHPEYDLAWSLADAMPINTTAPVTARDRFVIAFTEAELRQRIEEFRDLSISDDRLRERYFTRTRSTRHSPGDTRGWKLSQARRIIAADENWQQHILPCLYRPFDRRFIFWHPALIDWPRTEVTRHLVEGSGFRVQGSGSNPDFRPSEPRTPGTPWVPEPLALCLIARRQQLPTQPCTFFWITNGLALDGVIRSDNRGSESLFPLFIRQNVGRPGPGRPAAREDSDLLLTSHANFTPNFIHHVSKQLNLAWLPLARGDLDKTVGPHDLLAYIYALFHSPTYRDRYAHQLRAAFPRIVLTRDTALFQKMCRQGSELIRLHLLRTTPDVRPGDPSSIHDLTNFRVGGYPVLKKWLQPPHRSPADPHYRHIAATIAATIDLMTMIDESIAAHGGFPSAFTSLRVHPGGLST